MVELGDARMIDLLVSDFIEASRTTRTLTPTWSRANTRLEALRLARKRGRKTSKHLCYWDAFILQGDPGKMNWD